MEFSVHLWYEDWPSVEATLGKVNGFYYADLQSQRESEKSMRFVLKMDGFS